MPSPRPEGVGFVTDAPVRAVARRQIPASPDEVFAGLADAEGWPSWFPGMRRCGWLTAPPHRIGSKRRVVVGPLRVDERFVVFDRPHRFGFTFAATNLPVARAGVELVELEAVPEGTHVTYTMALQPPRGLAGAVGLAAGVISRVLAGGLRGLERHLAEHAPNPRG